MKEFKVSNQAYRTTQRNGNSFYSKRTSLFILSATTMVCSRWLHNKFFTKLRTSNITYKPEIELDIANIIKFALITLVHV